MKNRLMQTVFAFAGQPISYLLFALLGNMFDIDPGISTYGASIIAGLALPIWTYTILRRDLSALIMGAGSALGMTALILLGTLLTGSEVNAIHILAVAFTSGICAGATAAFIPKSQAGS